MRTYYIFDKVQNTWSANAYSLSAILAKPGITDSHMLADSRTRQTISVGQARANADKVSSRLLTPQFSLLQSQPTRKKIAEHAAAKSPVRHEYKVLDAGECEGGHMTAAALAQLLNEHARSGWRVLNCHFARVMHDRDGEHEEPLIILERHVRAEWCAQLNGIACAEGVQAIAQVLFQVKERGIAGAMPCIVNCWLFQELFGCVSYCFDVGAHVVKASDEDIRPEVVADIENATVGTTADEDAAVVLFNQQVLLVPESVGGAVAIDDGFHAIPGAGELHGHIGSLVQGDARFQGEYGGVGGLDLCVVLQLWE